MSWLLIRDSDGTIVSGPTEKKPTAFAGQRAVQTPLGYPDTMTWSPAARGFVPAVTEAELLADIDDERERRQMLMMTPGGAKKLVYARKEGEVRDYRSLLLSAINALGLADKQRRWPFAMAEAAITGETLAAVITRFEAAAGASLAEAARIEAIAQKGKRAVRAAANLAAKRAAAAAINWG